MYTFTAKEIFDIPEETNVYLVDETGTEVDEDVFRDVLEEKSDIVWTLTDACSVEGNSSTIKLGLSYLIQLKLLKYTKFRSFFFFWVLMLQ